MDLMLPGRVLTTSVILLVLAALNLPTVTAEPLEPSRYFPGSVNAGIACGAERHDPELPEGLSTLYLISWAVHTFCVGADVYNEQRELRGEGREPYGFGLAYWDLDADTDGKMFMVTSQDERFGDGQAFLGLHMPDLSWTEGCGPQMMPIHHRDGYPPRVLTRIDVVGIDDDTTACFATTGLLIPSVI